jgi:RHS repeat-associated protein
MEWNMTTGCADNMAKQDLTLRFQVVERWLGLSASRRPTKYWLLAIVGFAQLFCSLAVRAQAPTSPTYAEAVASCAAFVAAYRNPPFTLGPCISVDLSANPRYVAMGVAVYTLPYADYKSEMAQGWPYYGPPGVPGKNAGPSCHCATNPINASVADPINLGTGNEYRDEKDAALGALSFHRYYNSQPGIVSANIGVNWRDSFDRSVLAVSVKPAQATVSRPDGRQVVFALSGTVWVSDLNVSDTLTSTSDSSGNVTGWTYFEAATRHHETFDAYGRVTSIVDANQRTTSLNYALASALPSSGKLSSVIDADGRQLSFAYDSNGRIATVTLPDSGVLSYSYDSSGNLQQVMYPDQTTRQYIYNESNLTSGVSFPNNVTGVVDETGTRYASIGYDSVGHANSSVLAGNVDATQVIYNSDGTTAVTYPLGAHMTLNFVVTSGTVHGSTVSAPCGTGCDQPYAAATFDNNGYPLSATDFNGHITTTAYDANGLLDQQIDASGTSVQRTTNTTWNTTLRVPLTRTVLDADGTTIASTAWVYNPTGQPLARCEIDPAVSYSCATSDTPPAGVRRWTYTYCTAVDTSQCPIVGLLLSVDGPRTDVADVTTYAYYLTDSATSRHGDLQSVTDALGHTTTYLTYDGAGRVTSLQDANGVVTNLTYTPRGWLSTRTVDGATTTLTYTPYGAVASITDPDNITTRYTYDDAHRLTRITDAQGNDVQYTLDAAGDKTQEQIYTASGTVTHSLSRQFNTLGQLTAIVDGLNHTVFNAGYSDSYDANGNRMHSADALGIQSQQGFDALNRLSTTLANYNGTDPATRNTQTTVDYDALDRVDGVTDPSGLDTLYTYDGLGNRTALQSPDTGASSDTYDAAGNRLTHTDARGVVGTRTFDALNRITGISYAAAPASGVTYAWDEANSATGCASSAPIGRLTRIVENAVTTAYCYDNRGNILQKIQTTAAGADSTQYTYTAANRLSGESTPDHTAIAYAFDSDGRISGVTVTLSGSSTASPTVVSNVTWLPFGPIRSYTLGNGAHVARTYDANYRLTTLGIAGLTEQVGRDAMGDVTMLTNPAGSVPASESYQYDPLYRLTQVSAPDGTSLAGYTYDPSGDRLSKTGSGLATGAYLYTPGTHRLIQMGDAVRVNDANGNTTGSVAGAMTLGGGYDARNRLTTVQLNGQTAASYTYNALGERIGKVATFPSAVDTRYDYDEAGQLIGEYGTTQRDYIWLGALPVATVDNSVNAGVTHSTVSYIIADGLGTPRAVTDTAGNMLWQWSFTGNPFGELAPTSMNGYTLNLRYPGQYFDAETGLMDNGARDYDSTTGRYIQSDPIGLDGGISTYAYVGGDPLDYTDPLGLSTMVVCRPINDWRVKWAGIVHCGVFVWHMDCDGHRVIDSQYSLAGNRTPFPQGSNAPTAVDDRNAFFQGDGGINGVSDWYIPPPTGMTSAQFDAAVRAAGNSYNSGQDYDAKNGPNSNTAANSIIHSAGGTLPNVSGAWQQYYKSSH